MSDIDRIFARLGGGQTAGGDQRELRHIPRKGASAGRRTVEVVRLPTRGRATPGGGGFRRTDLGVRAESWDDGFPAKSAPPAYPAPLPVTAEAPEPVAHVMPTWTPASVQPGIDRAPAAPPEPAPSATSQPARRARRTAQVATRRVADPFDADDDGANCLRCGYAIEPARERRGLMTCAVCE